MENSPDQQQKDWDIKQGDYTPDPDSTNTYVKKVKRKYILERVVGIIVYAVIIGLIVYWIII